MKKYLALIRVTKVDEKGTVVDLKAISSNNKKEIDKWLESHKSGGKAFYDKIVIEDPSEELLNFMRLFETITRSEDRNILFSEEENRDSRSLYDGCINC